MQLYLADEELFMVAVAENEPDYLRRYWFFDSLAEAEDFINWWNDLDSDPEPIEEPDEVLNACLLGV